MNFVTAISNHLLPVFFVYGLAFFSLGLAASLQNTEDSTFSLRNCLWALAVFGFLHGTSEWADMFLTLGDAYWTPTGSMIIRTIGVYPAVWMEPRKRPQSTIEPRTIDNTDVPIPVANSH